MLTRLMLGLALVSLSACGKPKESSGTDTLLAMGLNGKWATKDCVNEPQNKKFAMKAQIHFEGDNFEARLESYDGWGCKNKTATMVLSGTYYLGELLEQESGKFELNYKVKKTMLAPGPDYVSKARESTDCGKIDWEADQLIDVSETPCKDDYWMAQAPFTVVRLTEHGLQLGKQEKGDDNGRYADTRHTGFAEFYLERTSAF